MYKFNARFKKMRKSFIESVSIIKYAGGAN